MLPALTMFLISVSLFIRQVHLDRVDHEEQDRIGDEHIMREIERFKKEKGIK